MPWTWRRLLSRKPSTHKGPPPARNNETSSTSNSDVGLKLLYTGVDPQVDIVAIHGKGGHRERSWTAANEVNWLRDLLPGDLPNSTIYTWGYESIEGTSLQAISESLVSDLWITRKGNARWCPIIFIAHSQGGAILKSALVYSNSAKNGVKPAHYAIKQATCGVIFASTLELDSRINGLETYVASIAALNPTASNDPTFNEARFLLTLLRQYAQIHGDFKTVYVRESIHTLDCESPSVDSKQQLMPTKEERDQSTISINASHGDTVKFQSSSDKGYLKFKENLLAMVKGAGQPGTFVQ